MSDPKAMIQAQQQQFPYLPLNYLPIIAKYDGTSAGPVPSTAIPDYAILTEASTLLPPIFGSARPPDAAAIDNLAGS
uniref:Uncharacterized protein n=1 Tax=Romanomermis culicivorax TaxID=13658 RepID=A0A915HSF9_ROMCU